MSATREQLRGQVISIICEALGRHARDVFEHGEAALPVTLENVEKVERVAGHAADRVLALIDAEHTGPQPDERVRAMGLIEEARRLLAVRFNGAPIEHQRAYNGTCGALHDLRELIIREHSVAQQEPTRMEGKV
jgi:hypothetical protein